MSKRFQFVAFLLAVALMLPTSTILADSFTATLTGRQEVPRVNTTASGLCAVVFAEVEGEDPGIAISCEHDVANATAAYVQIGGPGENGPVLFEFEDPDNVEGASLVGMEELVYLYTGFLYVNIESAVHPNGEIRGQIRFQTALDIDQAIFFGLSGEQEAPPVTTAAAGRCLSAIDEVAAGGEFFAICNHTVNTPTAAHVRRAAAGRNGPVVLTFDSAASPLLLEGSLGDLGLSPDFIDDFESGNLYVDVESTSRPNGEVRGQIDGCRNGKYVLCLLSDRFEVSVDWRTESDDSGRGVAVPETADSGMFWFFGPDNLELLVKVIDACRRQQRFWVFFAATTDVEFELRVEDTETGAVKTYRNELGQGADAVRDTDAFATCP